MIELACASERKLERWSNPKSQLAAHGTIRATERGAAVGQELAEALAGLTETACSENKGMKRHASRRPCQIETKRLKVATAPRKTSLE